MSAAPTRCPSAGELERLLAEELADADRTAVETHVETCPDCQGQLERLVATTAPLPATPAVPPESAIRAAGADEAFLDELRRLPPCPAGRNESSDDHLPTQLGPYEILGRLGRGGMGAVYKARHRELDRVVAIKVLPPDRVDESAVSRFRTEMRAAGRLDHPNIVTAHDAGRLGATHYLVTEFVDGTDLARLVARRGPLSVADACEIARQAAAGLRHAHERGLVHRDVKPSNLMLAKGGVVKVLDLGLARLPGTAPADGLTATGMLLGTADYIAPEQIDRASAAGDRADVYGLGATLYFLLVGEPPFGGSGQRSWLDKLRAHQLEPVPPLSSRRPDVPTSLAALVESMLAKDPADRPSAAAVSNELRPFTAGADLRKLLDEAGAASDAADAEPRAETAVSDDTRRGVPRSRPARNRARTAAVLAGLAGVAVVTGLVVRERGRDPDAGPPEPARVLALEVRQVRGPEAAPVGLIGVDRKPILVGDGVRVSVKFSAPAYAYLVAFNPDGAEQLCHPETPTGDGDRTSPPERAAELQFPRDGQLYFTLDRAGPQGFVLAASSRPLPPYEEWRKEAGPAPWKPDPRDSGGVWRFDGAAWAELAQKWELTPVSEAAKKVNLPFGKKQSGSGKVEPRGGRPSKEVADLGDFFRTRPEFDAVQVVSFPVFWPPK